jgi:glycolate oxidase FAD binding subunit
MVDYTDIREHVQDAATSRTALAIRGGGSKDFYGRTIQGETLAVGDYSGIIDYTPSELVISARAGTVLADLENQLNEQGQMLPFEPPHFGAGATLGGTIACGLSGPRRPYAGAARDLVLGINCISGKGEYLRFGGQVMKNVAGYDLSRMLTGSLGTLAVLLDIHLKVLPQPEISTTIRQPCKLTDALQRMNLWAAKPVPLSGGCYMDDHLYIRLSGTARGVQAAVEKLGGDKVDSSETFWQDLREQRIDFFSGDTPLWRLSVPPASAPLDLDGAWLIDWGGALRWLKTGLPAGKIRAAAAKAGGHATLFSGGDRESDVFQPLPPALLALHQRLKQSLDPAGILNPGRMYPAL